MHVHKGVLNDAINYAQKGCAINNVCRLRGEGGGGERLRKQVKLHVFPSGVCMQKSK